MSETTTPGATPELIERCTDAVAMAQAAGAQDAFAHASTSREIDFSYRDGALEKVQESTSKSLSLQLYVDGRYSSHSTTDLRPERLSSFIDEAIALTRMLEADPHRALPDPALYGGRVRLHLDLVDDGLDSVTEDQRIEWCALMDDRLHRDERVISSTSGVNQAMGSSAGVSSNGFTGQMKTTSIWMGTEVTLDDPGGGRPEAWTWVGGRHRDQLWEPEAIADNAIARGIARLESTKGPTRKTTMVVDPRSGGRLISALIRGARAQKIQQGRSFWADKQGQKLFSDALTLTDDPHRVRGLASRYYDGEGLASRKLPLIEAGVVSNVYVDTYYGRKAGLTPTTGSGSNKIVAPGEGDLEQILGDVGEGIYVTSWLGGNSDDTSGDFSFGLRGHLLSGGVVGAPIGEMNITGNLVELFASLVRVGADPWPYSTTLCPTLVFDGVQFSGA